MRFEEAYEGWHVGRLTQAQAAAILGVTERTFRRQMGRYEAEGMDGLIDQRLAQVSHRRAPVDEVIGLVDLYRREFAGWNVKHFHGFYRREHGGERGYTWVKLRLQEAGAVARAKTRGKHQARLPKELARAGITEIAAAIRRGKRCRSDGLPEAGTGSCGSAGVLIRSSGVRLPGSRGLVGRDRIGRRRRAGLPCTGVDRVPQGPSGRGRHFAVAVCSPRTNAACLPTSSSRSVSSSP